MYKFWLFLDTFGHFWTPPLKNWKVSVIRGVQKCPKVSVDPPIYDVVMLVPSNTEKTIHLE